ncbi:MAG: hypothetical protein AAF721_33220 [Myxococcota bacterium]
MAAVLDDFRTAPIEPPLRAALSFLEVLAKEPWRVHASALAPMRDAGLDDQAIEDVLAVGSAFAAAVRIADALGFTAPAKRDAFMMKHTLRRGYESRNAIADGFPRHHAGALMVQEAVLDASGPTERGLRVDLTRWAEAHVRGESPQDDALPEALRVLVGKEVRHAYRIVDEDLEALVEAGWEGEALFDVVVVVAVGTAVARYELGLRAIQGGAST